MSYFIIFHSHGTGYSIGAGVFGPTVRESPSSYPIVVMGAPGFSNNDGTVGAVSTKLIKERLPSDKGNNSHTGITTICWVMYCSAQLRYNYLPTRE